MLGLAAFIADYYFPPPKISPQAVAAGMELKAIYKEHNPEKVDDIPRVRMFLGFAMRMLVFPYCKFRSCQ